jgi:hypothetical protein
MNPLDHMQRIEKTKIIPLRWISNLFNHIGTPHLIKAFGRPNHGGADGLKRKYHVFMYKWTDAIYKKWGTVYTIDIDAWDKELDKEAGNK